MTDSAPNACRRCGTCCQKGGPALHTEDRHLVDQGLIPAADLFTIRRGEMARDNVHQRLVPLTEEIIKIKGLPGRWTCCYFEASTCGCGIYAHRPLECRALNCRDTREIEAIFDKGRLTRRDLLENVKGLWELVEDHEQRCGYGRLKRLAAQGAAGGRVAQEAAILEIIRYDALVRQLARSRGGLAAGMMEFVFGRPLTETIKMFDLRVVKQDGGYGLVETDR